MKPYLRPRSEPISAVIEGLALVKPFEYCLKSGHARTDQDGLMAFRRNQPLLRHVENGKYHLVITYNPNTIRSGQDGEIKVKDFAGRNGVDLIFPADDRPRIFVVGVL